MKEVFNSLIIVLCFFILGFVCGKSSGMDLESYKTQQISHTVPVPKDLHLYNEEEFRDYLKNKDSACNKIYSRQYVNYTYQCDRMSLTELAQNECYAEVRDLIAHLIAYCKAQEHWDDYKRRRGY